MRNKRDYIKTGKCIWCGKSKPEVSFNNEPHILPHSLGGTEIGYDICDDCNHYFGTARNNEPNIDLVFKEVFNVFRFFTDNLTEDSYKKFKTSYFKYEHNQNIVKIKSSFRPHIITRQFKRSLYNVFLQKYHYVTGNGNHAMFDNVRKFARYNIGNPKVYYAFNNILFTTADKENPILFMSENKLEDMMQSGIYSFWLLGHWFFLEIFPTAFNINGNSFLRKQAESILLPTKGNECIFELTNIMEIDFLMQRFNS